MAKAPTRAQMAVALARTPTAGESEGEQVPRIGEPEGAQGPRAVRPQPRRAIPRDALARGYAALCSTIGAIPGCSLATYSVAPFAGPDGKTATTLTVSGRGPSLHASIMEWKGRAALGSDSPADVARSLVAAFRTRIDRQAARAEEALATLGQPIPNGVFETNTDCLHLAVDRLAAWAESRGIAHETSGSRTYGDRVRLAVAMRASRAAKATIANTNDSGGTHVTEGDFSRIREVRTDKGIVRQVAIKHDIAGLAIGGSSVVIPNVTLPETLMLGARGATLGALVDASAKVGPGFARIAGHRVIRRVDVYGSGIIVDLEPELVRIDDLFDMTYAEITGETEPA